MKSHSNLPDFDCKTADYGDDNDGGEDDGAVSDHNWIEQPRTTHD